MIAIERKSPLDDTFVMVHRGPYLPPTHDQRQCEAYKTYLQTVTGVTDLAQAPVLPEPDSIVSAVLRSEVLSKPFGQADTVRFRFWNEPAASPTGVVNGRPYELGGGDAYVLLRSVRPDVVQLQIGSFSLGRETGLRARLIMETGAVEVLERW